MDNKLKYEAWLSELERIAATARKAAPPDTDVGGRVLARLRQPAPAAVESPLLWFAAVSGVGAMAAAMYVVSFIQEVTDPFAQWFQMGSMAIF